MATIDTQRLFFFLVILVFAGSIVALGSRELEQHFRKKRAHNIENLGTEMVRGLAGEIDHRIVKKAELKNRGEPVEEERARPILPPVVPGDKRAAKDSEGLDRSSLEQFLENMQDEKGR